MYGEPSKRSPGRRIVLLVVIPLAIAATGYVYYLNTGRYVETENAYVKAPIITVSPDVSGHVVWVGVHDNQPVRRGQVLLRIDARPFELAVAEAQARMAVLRTEIESLRAAYREALAAADEAGESVRFLDIQLGRQAKLRARGIGVEEHYDRARHDLSAARRRLHAIHQRIEQSLAELGGDPDIPTSQHPRYQQAEAARDMAAVELERTVVTAPADGIVTNMRLQAGEYVEEGKAVFTLIESSDVWVEANLKETQLTYVSENQAATVVIDAYPDVEWMARVRTIAPATGAEFALLPPQNATGNWVKVVQRIPVVLKIDRPAGTPVLRAGMTATVRIDTERERPRPALVQRITGAVRLAKAGAAQ